MSKNIRFTPPPPPPPPKNRDKSKNLRSVKTALRASTLVALGLLLALAVLLPNAAAEAQSSPASTATATATATTAPTTTDYDSDNDGLIDIKTLAQLNAVRYDLDGNGDSTHADYIAAFPNRDTTATGRMGCPLTDHDDDTATAQQATCTGYELMANLDFDSDGDGTVEATELYSNWTPIGTTASPFTATFKGNSNGATPKIATISNLTIIDRSTEVGLFGVTSATARIEGVGLVDVNVKPSVLPQGAKIGALVGNNAGKVIACYSTGTIDATAGSGSYAGGLVGYNTGTISASFSRATVDLEMEAGAIGGSTNIYAGGLAGYNSGTLTATYAAGAVKGKGGSGSVGGLVGHNTLADDAPSGTKTIIASYSIAPVTSVAYATTANPPTPTVGGLTGCCTDSTTITDTITASYWDYISSGIDDDSDTAMPEGKSTRDLTSTTSTSPDTSIYAAWKNLTIDGAVVPAPWGFNSEGFHPWLTYDGHTTATSGNQLYVNGGTRRGGDTIQPHEGMTLRSNMGSLPGSDLNKSRGVWRNGPWQWEVSTDGITWSNPVYSSSCSPTPGNRYCGPERRGASATYRFVPRTEHVGKYIRVKVPFTRGGYIYTRVLGKIEAAGTAPALSFASGGASPRVGTEITVAALPSGATDATGLWYRCDTNTSTSSGCELVGSLRSYIPGSADLNHYIRADIYYKKSGDWVRASTGFTTQKVADRVHQWR